VLFYVKGSFNWIRIQWRSLSPLLSLAICVCVCVCVCVCMCQCQCVCVCCVCVLCVCVWVNLSSNNTCMFCSAKVQSFNNHLRQKTGTISKNHRYDIKDRALKLYRFDIFVFFFGFSLVPLQVEAWSMRIWNSCLFPAYCRTQFNLISKNGWTIALCF
jgi:hypothetical protein